MLDPYRVNFRGNRCAPRVGVDHNSGHPSNRPRHLTHNRLITQDLIRIILQLRLVLTGFMTKARVSLTVVAGVMIETPLVGCSIEGASP
jgi:hypothetical protein